MRKLQYSLQTRALSLSLILSVTCGPQKLLALILYLSAVACWVGFWRQQTALSLTCRGKPGRPYLMHTQVHPTCTTPPDIVLPAHTCIEPGVFVLSNSGTSRCSCAQVSMCRHTCTVILSIHPKTCAEVRHTHTQSCINTHTLTSSQKTEIVTMTSGSARKIKEIAPEYSLSLDGARLNFRDSF